MVPLMRAVRAVRVSASVSAEVAKSVNALRDELYKALARDAAEQIRTQAEQTRAALEAELRERLAQELGGGGTWCQYRASHVCVRRGAPGAVLCGGGGCCASDAACGARGA